MEFDLGSTVVHVHNQRGYHCRIWPNTYLINNQTGERCADLIDCWGVGKYPHWEFVPEGKGFTLLFDALPESCKSFELIEDIPEPGGMRYSNILRCESDVYHLIG